MRVTVVLILVAAAALAQSPPEFETCLANSSAVTTSYDGKTYALASEACRDLFLTDPERYSQLYDALRELEREGVSIAPSAPSLVPS